MVREVSPPPDSHRVDAFSPEVPDSDRHSDRFLFTPSPRLGKALLLLTEAEMNRGDNVIPLHGELASAPIIVEPEDERQAVYAEIRRKLSSDDKTLRHLHLRKVITYKPGRTHATFEFMASLPPDFQEIFHSIPYLKQSQFGRSVLEVLYVVPNEELVLGKEARKVASRRIHDVVWGDDVKSSPPDHRNIPRGNAAYVTGIELRDS